jgi:molecular chaperone GrpE (heat shock protein)
MSKHKNAKHDEELKETTETPFPENTELTEIERLRKENEELNDKYLRFVAETENYKKRQQKLFSVCRSIFG